MALRDFFHNPFGKQPVGPPDMTPAGIGRYEKDQVEIEKKLASYKSHRKGLGRVIKHPLRVITEKPVNILIVCVPLALLVFIAGSAMAIQNNGIEVIFTSTIIDDLAVWSLLIVFIPLAILDTREASRVRHLEEALPNFFRDLAGMNDSGMTLPNAIHLVAGAEYSTLTPYIRRLDNEMSWNVPFIEAMNRFGQRLSTPLTDRSIDLIAKASKAGGDVSEVLRAAAKDTYEFVALRTDRRNNMLIYIVIVIISFLVFLFVIFILVTTFLTTMAAAGSSASGSGAGQQFLGSINVEFYQRIFAHAAMIQAVFSGLVAGQMGEGRVIAGVKYSAIMLIIAWVLFRFFI
jgi:archaeal flagellar protein FlaJ